MSAPPKTRSTRRRFPWWSSCSVKSSSRPSSTSAPSARSWARRRCSSGSKSARSWAHSSAPRSRFSNGLANNTGKCCSCRRARPMRPPIISKCRARSSPQQGRVDSANLGGSVPVCEKRSKSSLANSLATTVNSSLSTPGPSACSPSKITESKSKKGVRSWSWSQTLCRAPSRVTDSVTSSSMGTWPCRSESTERNHSTLASSEPPCSGRAAASSSGRAADSKAGGKQRRPLASSKCSSQKCCSSW
mmetsp:Transcript_24084/g.81325  ORF Transcript_24084/g.81325 Transcript_24084/m.81325 type:complete len:246 (-) Transcript_24084:386-1123(-)